MDEWQPYFRGHYDPLAAGSIDGTDETPHDKGVSRALTTKYHPNKGVTGDPACTIFVSSLNFSTTEDVLRETFSVYGAIKRVHVVRDVVTGYSKGYAFVEYDEAHCASRAQRNAHKNVLDDKEIIVEFEQERTLQGWIPRRLGGGFGGKKGSGQLRFGCKERPFRKPIVVAQNVSGGRSRRDFPENVTSYRPRFLDEEYKVRRNPATQEMK